MAQGGGSRDGKTSWIATFVGPVHGQPNSENDDTEVCLEAPPGVETGQFSFLSEQINFKRILYGEHFSSSSRLVIG